jgi:hypothetical protein
LPKRSTRSDSSTLAPSSGRADLGLRLGRHHAALGGAACGEHLLVLDRQVGAHLHLVLQTQGLELGVEVALREPGVQVLDLQVACRG